MSARTDQRARRARRHFLRSRQPRPLPQPQIRRGTPPRRQPQIHASFQIHRERTRRCNCRVEFAPQDANAVRRHSPVSSTDLIGMSDLAWGKALGVFERDLGCKPQADTGYRTRIYDQNRLKRTSDDRSRWRIRMRRSLRKKAKRPPDLWSREGERGRTFHKGLPPGEAKGIGVKAAVRSCPGERNGARSLRTFPRLRSNGKLDSGE